MKVETIEATERYTIERITFADGLSWYIVRNLLRDGLTSGIFRRLANARRRARNINGINIHDRRQAS